MAIKDAIEPTTTQTNEVRFVDETAEGVERVSAPAGMNFVIIAALLFAIAFLCIGRPANGPDDAAPSTQADSSRVNSVTPFTASPTGSVDTSTN
jgi:hypothetical protein